MTNKDQVREAFEQWATINNFDLDIDDGQYEATDTNAAWATWQALAPYLPALEQARKTLGLIAGCPEEHRHVDVLMNIAVAGLTEPARIASEAALSVLMPRQQPMAESACEHEPEVDDYLFKRCQRCREYYFPRLTAALAAQEGNK